jgi:hypothetical protein
MQVAQESFDPRIGDKRPREEDESEAQAPMPVQSYMVKQDLPTGPRIPSGPAANSGIPNGAMQSNSAISQGQAIEEGLDSLYIGDLQWVRHYLFSWEVYTDRLLSCILVDNGRGFAQGGDWRRRIH